MFTDEDLERLKEDLLDARNKTSMSPDCFKITLPFLIDLVVRLEAAEHALELDGHSGKYGWDIEGIKHCDCGNVESYEAWRKSAGK